MIEFFDGLTHWHWLGLTAVVLGARALMPFGMAYTLGRGVLALALTAGIVGLALTAVPDLTGFQQLGLAVLASAPSAYGMNWWAERRGHGSTRDQGPILVDPGQRPARGRRSQGRRHRRDGPRRRRRPRNRRRGPGGRPGARARGREGLTVFPS